MKKFITKKCRLKYFPMSFFSITMGMSGMVIILQKMETFLDLFKVSSYFLVLTVILFVLFLIIYFFKFIIFRKYVIEEFDNPIKLNFFPTFSISLLLLSIAFLVISPSISKYLLIMGAIIHLIFTIKIISIWIYRTDFKITHMNPAWFIPAVGNILVPISGVKFLPIEISWFFFSIGLMFWIILLIIFFNRIIFHEPLPEKLLPTLFILIAPPAVGFISLVKLTEQFDSFSKILYYFALFLVLLLFSQFRIFTKVKFYLSWWAYLFPITAITTATFLMFHETKTIFFKNLFIVFLTISILLFLILFIKTIQAIIKKELCVEEN